MTRLQVGEMAHNTQPSSVPRGVPWLGDQGPAQLQPDPRRQNPAQGKACHRHDEPPPHRCGMETITQGLSGLPVPDCRAAVRKRGHCTHTCSQHTRSYLAFSAPSPAPSHVFARILFQENSPFTTKLCSLCCPLCSSCQRGHGLARPLHPARSQCLLLLLLL